MNEGWQLLESGRPREAIDRFREEYAQYKSRGILMNIGLAYLCLDDIQAAAIQFAELIATKPHFSTGEYSCLGVCRWLANRRGEAVAVWQDGLECKMADGAGGVELPLLLFFASVRAENVLSRAEPIRLLKKRMRDGRSVYWPGPIAKYVLGELSDDQLRQAACHYTAQIGQRQQHKAEFYIGVSAKARGDHEAYASQMRKCSEMPAALLNDELHLARFEARLALDGEF